MRSQESRMGQTEARLMASAWASLTMVAAISSRVQPFLGRSCSAVLLVAIVITARCSSGGKAPGSAGARGVLKALEAFGHEAFAPLANGMAVTIQFLGDVLVGRVVILRGTQDDAAAEGESLGSRTRS